MKVIVAVILVIGSASAIGSGPYLPSGWRPKGPAFFLPSEVQKPAENPLKETILIETEALGSEGLREYGPPVEFQNVAQALPDAITEQTFYIIDTNALVQQQQISQENLEQRTASIQEAFTESQAKNVDSKTQDYQLEVTATYDAATEKLEAAFVTAQAEVVIDQAEVVTEQAKVVSEQAEVVSEQADVVTEQAEVVTEQAKVMSEQVEVVAKQAEVVSEQADVVTEQAEVVSEQAEVVAKQAEVVSEQAEVVAKQAEVVSEQAEVVTEKVEVATDKVVVEVVSEVKEEASVAAVEEKLENIVVAEEKLGNIVVQEEEKIAEVVQAVEGVRNIAEALVTIENEIKAEQVQQSIETVGELKVIQEGSGVAQVPEGFLEYGPPGFREYGPPKGDELLRSNVENEVRRRRFSPKFRLSQNKKH